MLKQIAAIPAIILFLALTPFASAQTNYMEIFTENGGKEILPVPSIDSIKFFQYGDSVSSVTDIDGNGYKTIKIGNQWWMAENLKVTHYRNGDSIALVEDEETWLGYTGDAYCIYENISNNAKIYGCLYNGSVIGDTRNIAPDGWHVPVDAEWDTLARHISTDNGGYTQSSSLWEDVSGHLKALSGWNSGGNGTDDYGFTGVPAGFRDLDGIYDETGEQARFWTASYHSQDNIWTRFLDTGNSRFFREGINYRSGLSVRCVKD